MAASQNGHREAVQLLTDGRADVALSCADGVKTVSPAKAYECICCFCCHSALSLAVSACISGLWLDLIFFSGLKN